MRNTACSLALALLLATPSAAASATTSATPSTTAHPRVITGVDALTSTVFQEGQSSFSGVALRFRLHPARMIERLELMPGIEYWRNSSSLKPYDIESVRKDATVTLEARYAFNPKGWQPYVGAGLGIHFLSTRVRAPSFGLPDASDSVIKGGLAGLAGVTLGLTGRLDNFFELEYHHIPDSRQLKINWGL